MQKSPVVSVIIVNFDNVNETVKCIKSVNKFHPNTSFEIIVVDNSGKAKNKKNISKTDPKVKYLKSTNVGYGAGNNIGAKKAKGKYLLILNPDTEVLKKSIDNLFSILESDEKIWVVAPVLIDSDKKPFPQLGSQTLTPLRAIFSHSIVNKIFPNNPIAKSYWHKDKDQQQTREVDVVPGSAFLIRKDKFIDIGMFDENIFLYFEESDLGIRIKKAGGKLFITNKSKVVHIWEDAVATKNKYKNKIFLESRKYYFKKHFGLVKAFCVELALSFGKMELLLLLFSLVSIVLSLYKLEERLVFHGELGDNYYIIKTFLDNRQIPLVGPPTSHEWLNFGPLYYWIFAPILIMFNYSPIAGGVFFSLLKFFTIWINYFVVKKLINQKAALISSAIISTSPLFSYVFHEARFYTLIIPFSYLLAYKLNEILKNKNGFLFFGLLFGLTFNFHITPLIILPSIFVLLERAKLIKVKNIFLMLSGFIIPTIPFVLSDAKTGFVMTKNFLIWIPYRIAGFSGLYPKNNPTPEKVVTNLRNSFDFITQTIGPNYGVISVVIISLLVYSIIKNNKNKITKSMLLVFSTSMLALFIHNDIPTHYFIILYPIPVVLFAQGISKFKTVIQLTILAILSAINITYINSSFNKQTIIPYKDQLRTVQEIIDDSKNEMIYIKRIGPYDNFDKNFAQNYLYLFWIMGKKTSSERQGSQLYTITENPPEVSWFKQQ